MRRLSRPSSAASHTRSPPRASWVVRVLMVAAVVGGVRHFIERFSEEAPAPTARISSSQRTRSHRSEPRRAARPPPVVDDATGVRAGQADHDEREAPELPAGLAGEPDGQACEVCADEREPPGYDTGIVITPVTPFEKDEPRREVARIERLQPDIVAVPPEHEPNEAEQAHQHVDPAVDTGIIVTPMGYPASAK